jgi:hypothetical protein
VHVDRVAAELLPEADLVIHSLEELDSKVVEKLLEVYQRADRSV